MIYKSVLSRTALALLATFVGALPAMAEPAANEYLPVAFRAFGTLGIAHTQGDGAGFIRDMSQPKGADNRGLDWQLDTRLGVQANLKVSDDFEAAAQIVSRYRNDNNFQPEPTWAYLKYSLNDTADIRVGRVGFDAFLSADSRDVGYSFLWVRPPVDYYGNLFFNYSDGGDITFRMPTGPGRSRLKLFAGIARERSSSLVEQRVWAGNITRAPIGTIQDLDGSRGSGAFIDYQDKHWIARLGIARLKVTQDFPLGNLNVLGLLRTSASQAYSQSNTALGQALTSFANDMQPANKRINFGSIDLAYEDGPLHLQMAVNRITSDTLLIADSHAGFFSAGYRIGSTTPYAVVSGIKPRRSKRADELSGIAPTNVVSLANFLVSAPLTDQRTYSFGIRHELARNISLKVQADMIRNRKALARNSKTIISPTRRTSACCMILTGD